MSSEIKQENVNENHTCENSVNPETLSQNAQQITGLSDVQKPIDNQDEDEILRTQESIEIKAPETVPADGKENEKQGDPVTEGNITSEEVPKSHLSQENEEKKLHTGIQECQNEHPMSLIKQQNNTIGNDDTSEGCLETAYNKQHTSNNSPILENLNEVKAISTVSELDSSTNESEMHSESKQSNLGCGDNLVLEQNRLELDHHTLDNPIVESLTPGNKDPKTIKVIPEDVVQTPDENQAAAASPVNSDQSLKAALSKSEAKKNDLPSLHHVKCIQFKDKKTCIITQNENGPCPLVAIMNVMLLRHQVNLPSNSEIVPASKLLEYIGNEILENVPEHLTGANQLNYEQNMQDAVAILSKLQTGLDVNVKYTGVRDFEYTPECIIFDLLHIPLYHAWLVDPQLVEVVSAIGQAGYNQLVEKVLNKTSNDPKVVHEALVIENFLENTASQMTYHGLSELASTMKNEEIAVLFRNNHFSTIYKHKNELFQLVTDQGFLGEPNVVWETLSNIDGDGEFVDNYFKIVPPKPESTASSIPMKLTTKQQIDQDYLVALSLQEEQPGLADDSRINLPMTEEDKTTQELLDANFARQLQEREEQELAAREAERTREGGSSPNSSTGAHSGSREQKRNNCTIL